MTSPFDAFKQIFPDLADSTALLVFLYSYFAFLFVIYLLYCFAAWRIFTKMGEKGWKSLIPIYNLYILTKRVSNKKYFASMLTLMLVTVISSVVSTVLSTIENSGGAYMFFNIINIVAYVALFVIQILLCNKVSKAFGHGAGFTLGLIFFTFIFELILAFGSSEYIGCGDSDKTASTK